MEIAGGRFLLIVPVGLGLSTSCASSSWSSFVIGWNVRLASMFVGEVSLELSSGVDSFALFLEDMLSEQSVNRI